MKNKFQIATWAAFVLLVGGVIIYAITGNGNNSNAATAGTGGDGDPQTVQILKYSDYQCPACAQYIPLQEELKREFGDLVEIEYRHFPLGGFEYSELAARVVEAASEQGEREGMHDRIFEAQSQWSAGGAEQMFFGFAEDLGLDMNRFETDVESDEIRQRVQSQRAEGERRQVRSTPTFFLNGQRLQQNPQSYDQFRAIVEMHMYR